MLLLATNPTTPAWQLVLKAISETTTPYSASPPVQLKTVSTPIPQLISVLTCAPKILISTAKTLITTITPVFLHALSLDSLQTLSQELVYQGAIQVKVYTAIKMTGDAIKDVPLDLAIL